MTSGLLNSAAWRLPARTTNTTRRGTRRSTCTVLSASWTSPRSFPSSIALSVLTGHLAILIWCPLTPRGEHVEPHAAAVLAHRYSTNPTLDRSRHGTRDLVLVIEPRDLVVRYPC